MGVESVALAFSGTIVHLLGSVIAVQGSLSSKSSQRSS